MAAIAIFNNCLCVFKHKLLHPGPSLETSGYVLNIFHACCVKQAGPKRTGLQMCIVWALEGA